MSGKTIQIEEIAKCSKDFVYFCENYIIVKNKEMKLYDYQKRIIKELEQNKFNISVAFRQCSWTTLSQLYLFWNCIFRRNNKVATIAMNAQQSNQMQSLIYDVRNNLPDFLNVNLVKCEQGKIEIEETNSVMYFSTCLKANTLPNDLTYLVMDNLAYIQNADELWAIMEEKVVGSWLVYSNPHFEDKVFSSCYKDALIGRNKFHTIKIDYKEHPVFGKTDWEEDKIRQIGVKNFAQEYLGAFLA